MQGCCQFPACDRPVSATGLCRTHYMQKHRYGRLNPIRAWKPKDCECEHEGCLEPVFADGICRLHYSQRTYQAHKDDVLARTNARRKVNKAMTDERKLASGCVFCGYNEHPAALDFHHVDPAEKSFNIGRATGFHVDRIKAELDKCIVVCANCHRVLGLK